jgi:hypothetical protein
MKDLGATYKVPTKVIVPPPASGKVKKKPDASGTKGGASPIGASGKGTAKPESAPASPAGGKKSEVKTEAKKEVGSTKPAPAKQDKPTTKKMAPPAAAGKGAPKKPASGKPTTGKDSTKKSSTKAKLTGTTGDAGKGKKSPGKGKASDTGKTKKGSGSGKTSGGSASMSASLTKKKPK